MTENFKDFKKNEQTYALACKICDFFSNYDSYEWFDQTGHFQVEENDIESAVELLQNDRTFNDILSDLNDILRIGEPSENEIKTIKDIIKEMNEFTQENRASAEMQL